MNGFEFDEHIARSPLKVFEVLSDPTRATEFLDNIKESKKLTDGPIAVGTRFRETRIMNGKEASAELVVSAYEPNTHVGISTEAEGILSVGGVRISQSCATPRKGRLERLELLTAGVTVMLAAGSLSLPPAAIAAAAGLSR